MNTLSNNLFRRANFLLTLCFAVCVSLAVTACLDVHDDDESNVTKYERALVEYLEANYPGKWKQFYASNLYYVPMVETTQQDAVTPRINTHCVQISYNMWKQDDYSASWTPTDQDLISTSDSTLSMRYGLLRNYLHGGPEIYPYINGLSDFAAVFGEMKSGETYRVFLAPSTLSGFKDYTRVVDVTLENVFEGNAWTAEETAIFKSYRMATPALRSLTFHEKLFSYEGASVSYTNLNGDSFVVESAAKSGTIQYALHEDGIGDPLTHGGKFFISYSMGYLQRNHDGKAIAYVPLQGMTTPEEYDILTTYRFGKGFDVALSCLRQGAEATLFIPAVLAYGWSGQTVKQGLNDSELYLIPPQAPLVFHVKIYDSLE